MFAAAPNTVVGPVKSAFGWQVLEVTKVTPGTERTFDQVKDEIRTKIAQDRAVDLVYDRANKLEDALSAGTPLDHLPGDLGLAGVSGTLDAQGNTPEGEPAPIPGTPGAARRHHQGRLRPAEGRRAAHDRGTRTSPTSRSPSRT